MAFDGEDTGPEQSSPGDAPRLENSRDVTRGDLQSADERDLPHTQQCDAPTTERGERDGEHGSEEEPAADTPAADTPSAEPDDENSAESAQDDDREHFVTLPVGPDVGLAEVVAAAQEVDHAQRAWHPGMIHSQTAAVLGATAPGASLATVIDQAVEQDLTDRDQATRIELIAACDRMMSYLAGVQARFAGEFLDQRGASLGSLTATHDEIAARLATTSYAAGTIISRAGALADSPRLREALSSGEVSARKIDVITAAVSGMGLRERILIEDYGIELAPTHTPPQLKKALAAAVIAADPSKAKERHEKEVKERCVTFEPAPHGMAWLGAYLPAEDALSIYTCLDAIAANHAADDERCIHARRADALTDVFSTMMASGNLLDGTSLPSHHGQLPHLHLSITAPVLAGDEHTPALLHGYGPIDAGHARALAERAAGHQGASGNHGSDRNDGASAGVTTGSSLFKTAELDVEPPSAAHTQGRSNTTCGPRTGGEPGSTPATSNAPATSPPTESAPTGSSERLNLQGTVPGACPVAPGVLVGLGAHPGATWSERCDLLERLGPDATADEVNSILGPAHPWENHRSRAEDEEIWRQLLDQRSSPPHSPGSPEEPDSHTRFDGADPDDPDPEWTWMCRYLPRLDPMWGLIPPPRAPHLPDGTDARALIAWLGEQGTVQACANVENQLGLICTDAYAPSRRLRSRIIERDQTCRFPTCQVPAWRCQLDHIVAFDEALPAWAQTVETNLHALCAHHHQIKTAGLFTVEREPRTGITTWHAPTGHVYSRAPEHADYTAIAHHLRDDYAMTICEDDPVCSVDLQDRHTAPAGAAADPDVHRWLPESTAPVAEQRARLAAAAPDAGQPAGMADAAQPAGVADAATPAAGAGNGWPSEPPF